MSRDPISFWKRKQFFFQILHLLDIPIKFSVAYRDLKTVFNFVKNIVGY